MQHTLILKIHPNLSFLPLVSFRCRILSLVFHISFHLVLRSFFSISLYISVDVEMLYDFQSLVLLPNLAKTKMEMLHRWIPDLPSEHEVPCLLYVSWKYIKYERKKVPHWIKTNGISNDNVCVCVLSFNIHLSRTLSIWPSKTGWLRIWMTS